MERIKRALGNRDLAWLSRETGIPTSTLSDLAKKIPRTDRAVKIARALDTSVEALFGDGPAQSLPVDVLAADEADFVNLPRYDLGELRETSKGNRVETTPIRRDWLYRKVGRSADLWLTELPSRYEALNLEEGDVVICSDLVGDRPGPQEGWVCIFRSSAGMFVAKYSNLPGVESSREPVVTAADQAAGDVHPIARIHARMLARV